MALSGQAAEDTGRHKAPSIIANLQNQARILPGQADGDLPGARVAGDVGQRLLRDPIEIYRRLFRQGLQFLVGSEMQLEYTVSGQ